ncbi:MAG: acylphosphatase [Pyrinomonadaceae bacterium]
MTDVRLTALVRGRVQGVGFRYWSRSLAKELGLNGSATNMTDGRVEVVVEGSRETCQVLLDALGSDRVPGWVEDIAPSWGEASGVRGFAVR